MTHPTHYIWQDPAWPDFRWNGDALLKSVGDCRFQQGSLLAQMRELGFEVQQQAQAEALIEDALKTSEIEGEHLDPQAVRSSVARRLGLPSSGLPKVRDQQADRLVDILLDATKNYDQELNAARIFGWHAALFPTGYSGLHKIKTATWRDDREGPMRIVSGPIGREKIHYEAPPAGRMEQEMNHFFAWWKKSRNTIDGILRAGIAHLWFVSLHPFEDGNGRIARTLSDMALAQDEKLSTRFYSTASQIMAERDTYYEVLENTNKGTVDITPWLKWFVGCISRAILRSDELLSNIVNKAQFWKYHAQMELTDRQRKAINSLLEAGPDGFAGGMTNRKYAGITHISRATAQRDLADLVEKGILHPNPAGGRSVSYNLVWDDVRW
jgi:Fic family protein